MTLQYTQKLPRFDWFVHTLSGTPVITWPTRAGGGVTGAALSPPATASTKPGVSLIIHSIQPMNNLATGPAGRLIFLHGDGSTLYWPTNCQLVPGTNMNGYPGQWDTYYNDGFAITNDAVGAGGFVHICYSMI